jgi:hypothetical protein
VPRQKNFKRLVRTRMTKTGESYTAARSHFQPPVVAGDPEAATLARAAAAAGFVNPATGDPFTDALLFGAGGGIGFNYLVFVYPGWTSVNVDGRFNALYFDKKSLVEIACERLGLPLRVRPTVNPETTEKQLRQALAGAAEVAMTVDLVKVPDARPVDGPYAPHMVTVQAADSGVTVTGLSSGRATMTWNELIEARWTHAKKYGGLYVFGKPVNPQAGPALATAIGRTMDCLLEPTRSSYDGNFGVPGIHKWARLITDTRDRKAWPKLFPDPDSLSTAMETVANGLNGVATSRRRYAVFLNEAATLLDAQELTTIAATYQDLAGQWAALAKQATPADLAAQLPALADAEGTTASNARDIIIGSRA